MALTRATDKIIANADGNLNLSGIVTASSFVGNVTGAVTPSGDVNVGSNIKLGAASGIITATSFSGALTGTTGTFSSNVSITGNLGVGGTVTYEDVSNVDSVGIITARTGIQVSSGSSIGIGTDKPSASLYVHESNIPQGFTPHTDTAICAESSTNANIEIATGHNSTGALYFSDTGAVGKGKIEYLHGSGGDLMTFQTNGSERLRVGSSGQIGIAGANYGSSGQVLTSAGSGSAVAWTTISTDLVSDTSPQLGGDLASNSHDILFADNDKAIFGTGSDFKIYHNGTDNYIMASNGHIRFDTGSAELARITSTGKLLVGTQTEGSTEADDLTIATSGHTGITLRSGTTHEGNIFFSDGTSGADEYRGLIRYDHDGDKMIFGTGDGTERLRITSDGKIGINDSTPSVTLETVGHNQVTFGSMPETIITYGTASAYNSGSAGSGIQFGGKYNSSGEYTIFAGVHGVKSNTSNGPYGGALILSVRQNNTSSFERMRVSEYGTITNTTASSHSQGAGTFNIKGIINQYSQGSGSGLIFDCDFGRLTGYSDDSNVNNGTNLSACLAHSTTDWTSSSSNTPMTVNGGTFQYRVGFGGYFDAISNGGRVSVAAGSGSPSMASTLNTANMTIECWCWYDGDGREVLVSRYGSGYPAQFNMICDPNGQFHYNNGGVGAGSGNVSGEHFPDKTWHHHVWQYESGVNRWYINGAFANSRSAGSSLAVSSSTGFAIFSRADRLEDFRGKIAIVRIYNRALSAAEIKNHFELERGRFGV